MKQNTCIVAEPYFYSNNIYYMLYEFSNDETILGAPENCFV